MVRSLGSAFSRRGPSAVSVFAKFASFDNPSRRLTDVGRVRFANEGGMIVIIGAGLIGLCTAYELAKRGAEVRVVEAHDSAASASWTGAGRLAPFSDSEGGDEEQEEFLGAALGTYQVFVKELHKRTGIDPCLRVDGIIEVAHDEFAAVRLRDRAAALVARGIPAHWFEPNEIRGLEPALGPATVGASVIEDEGQIDSRYLGRALRAACVDV